MNDVGDALVDVVLDGTHERRRRRWRDILEWFAAVAKPPTGVRLVSDDGDQFTGLVVVESNRPVLMLALCTGGTVRRDPRSPYERYMRPIDDELWSRDPDDPFR